MEKRISERKSKNTEAWETFPRVNVHGRSRSRNTGHLSSAARVLLDWSRWAHVPFIIMYAPEFTIL